MWGNHGCLKLPHSLNMEFMYDVDMLEMIRWPYVEGFSWPTQEFLRYMTLYQGLCSCKELGHCRYHHRHHHHPSTESTDRDECDVDQDEADEFLMVTSNDALRFEEDCLFESPVSSSADVHSPGFSSDAVNDSQRFLCQKTSSADMTLAQLNDSSASDAVDKINVSKPKAAVEPLDQDLDPLTENFLPAASKTLKLSSLLLSSKEQQSSSSRPLASVQYNCIGLSGNGSLHGNEEFKAARSNGLRVKNRTEQISSTKSTCKSFTKLQDKTLSSTVKSEVQENWTRGNLNSRKRDGDNSNSELLSSFSAPAEKKIKLEITDDSYDQRNFASGITAVAAAASSKAPSKTPSSDAENTDTDENFSDAESVLSKDGSVQELLRSSGSLDKRFFWQYNIQAKGPKEKRLCRNVVSCDPHVLKDFEDPVFDPGNNNVNFVHSGKARKGDGTDITPNAQKLLDIGIELKTLNNTIERMMQSPDLTTRMNTLKEKNKYASRVCRLKKKAQHEANKIKLQGLNQEHNQLMFILNSIRSQLRNYKKVLTSERKSLFTEELDTLTKSHLKVNVAGHSDEYVSEVLSESIKDKEHDIWLYSD